MLSAYKHALLFAAAIVLLVSSSSTQAEIKREVVDSLWHNKYLAVKYYIPFDTLKKDID